MEKAVLRKCFHPELKPKFAFCSYNCHENFAEFEQGGGEKQRKMKTSAQFTLSIRCYRNVSCPYLALQTRALACNNSTRYK